MPWSVMFLCLGGWSGHDHETTEDVLTFNTGQLPLLIDDPGAIQDKVFFCWRSS